METNRGSATAGELVRESLQRYEERRAQRQQWKAVIEATEARTDIVALVRQYTGVEPKRARYWGFCPFHIGQWRDMYEIVVDPVAKTWTCHGSCGWDNDMFQFIEAAERQTLPEAIRFLARRAGVTFDENGALVEEREALPR